MMMTGVLFFTNDVFITTTDLDTDESITRKYFTMKEDAGEILTEFGYAVGEFDRIVHGKNEDGVNSIRVINGFAVQITVDGDTFTTGAIDGEDYNTILAANSVAVGEYDVVVSSEHAISVIRGFGVNVTADGKTVTVGMVETSEATVDEILRSAGITVGVGDIVNLPVNANVSQGDEIVVGRVTHRERSSIEPIQYETSIEYSNLVAIGDSKITDGVYGETTFIFREKLVDGVVVTSEVISREVTKEPVNKIVTRGNALATPYSQRDFAEIRLENGLPVDYLEKISGLATAYTAPPTSGTASGRKLEIGTVAVDPRIIPYGSLLYIVSSCGRVYGAAIAADTGGFIYYTDRFVVVDVFMGLTSEHYSEALRWGLKNVDVYVINSGVY
jgi:3D (Asp-Asp-Asp) domain-containing protein/uncharacterized protein with GYD domain